MGRAEGTSHHVYIDRAHVDVTENVHKPVVGEIPQRQHICVVDVVPSVVEASVVFPANLNVRYVPASVQKTIANNPKHGTPSKNPAKRRIVRSFLQLLFIAIIHFINI